MRQFPNHLPSAVVYYGVLCALVAGVVALCRAGFTYRRTEADSDGLAIHEGFWEVIWKHRVVPRSQIRSVERYECSRRGKFGRVPVSEIRVHLVDGSSRVLAESTGSGKYEREVAEVRRALGDIGDPPQQGGG